LKVDALLAEGFETAEVDVAHDDGAFLSWVYRHGEVLSRRDDDTGIHLTVRLSPENRRRLAERRPSA
jgi:GTP-binding protein HflX